MAYFFIVVVFLVPVVILGGLGLFLLCAHIAQSLVRKIATAKAPGEQSPLKKDK